VAIAHRLLCRCDAALAPEGDRHDRAREEGKVSDRDDGKSTSRQWGQLDSIPCCFVCHGYCALLFGQTHFEAAVQVRVSSILSADPERVIWCTKRPQGSRDAGSTRHGMLAEAVGR
jgi:hypothetical protein